MPCQCNEQGYTCELCEAPKQIQELLDYTNEFREWTIESLKAIAAEVGVNILPPPPRKP